MQVNKFDIQIVNPVLRKLNERIGEFEPELFLERRKILAGVDLQEAQDVIRIVTANHGNAYLIPVAYRESSVTMEEAKKIALKEYENLKVKFPLLDPLQEGYDDYLWWSFKAEDPDAIDRGIIPGVITIAVDKLSGEVRNREAHQKWLQLQRGN